MNKHFSVIILTYNAEKTIQKLLNTLLKYKDYIIEILIIDSSSSDKTHQIIAEYSKNRLIHVYKIDKRHFNHGDTRNLAVKKAKGKYCVFISQDAIPMNNFFPYFMKDFNIDKKVVAVFGKQIPRKSSPIIQQIEYLCRFDELNKFTKDGILVFNKKMQFIEYNDRTRYLWYSLFNTFACYKKSFLYKNPFPRTMYGEDLFIGKKIVKEGYIKIYDNRCEVLHSHSLSMHDYFKSQIVDINHRIYTLDTQERIRISQKIIKLIKTNFPVYKKVFYLFELGIYYTVKLLAYSVVLLRRRFFNF